MAKLVRIDRGMLEETLAASYDIWNEGLSREAYSRYYTAQLKTRWGARHLDRVALVDGTVLLASAKIYALAATLDGRRIRVAGLGAVFTQPAYRGRGAARELIDRILDQQTRDGADLALLFSEIAPDYYERFGFERVPTADTTVGVAQPARGGAPATLVRAGDDRDLADLAAMHRARADAFRFALDRDADWIQYAIAKRRLLAGLGAAGARHVQFFIAEEGASAVAYVVISVTGGEWTIEECGDRDPSGARVGAILQVLLAREPAERRPRIHGSLPAGFVPPQLTIVERQPSREVMMTKPLTSNGRATPPLAEPDVLYWHGDVF